MGVGWVCIPDSEVEVVVMDSAVGGWVLTRGLGAEGEVQFAAVREDPILRFHICRVNMCEPADAIVSLLEVGAFGVEKIEVGLCSATSG